MECSANDAKLLVPRSEASNDAKNKDGVTKPQQKKRKTPLPVFTDLPPILGDPFLGVNKSFKLVTKPPKRKTPLPVFTELPPILGDPFLGVKRR